MKIVLLILGLVFAIFGLGLTGYSWYAAVSEGKIIEGLAYAGPFLLIIGIWRGLSAASPAQPHPLLRLAAVGIGIAAGFGNTAIQKAVFPDDQRISTTNSTH